MYSTSKRSGPSRSFLTFAHQISAGYPRFLQPHQAIVWLIYESASECAETLISVRQEVHDAGSSVTLELQESFNKLRESVFPIHQSSEILWFINRAFENVKRLVIKEAHRPFIKRYLKQNDIMRNISSYDAEIRLVLDMFNVCIPSVLSSLLYSCYHLQLSVSIRILKQSQESEKNRRIEVEALLTAVSSQKEQEQNPSNSHVIAYIP